MARQTEQTCAIVLFSMYSYVSMVADGNNAPFPCVIWCAQGVCDVVIADYSCQARCDGNCMRLLDHDLGGDVPLWSFGIFYSWPKK